MLEVVLTIVPPCDAVALWLSVVPCVGQGISCVYGIHVQHMLYNYPLTVSCRTGDIVGCEGSSLHTVVLALSGFVAES